MSRRGAVWVSRSLLVVATIAVIASVPFWFAIQRSADATSIIVIGDETAPRVAELRAELRERVADGSFLPDGPNLGFVLIFLFCLGWIVVGSIIVSRQPSNWAGWLFVVVGLPLPLLSLAQSFVVYGARVPGADVPFLGAWAVFGEYALYPVVLLPLLFLLYPDGRVPSPRWRWAVVGLLGGVALALVGFAFRPGPLNNWVDQGILYVNPIGIDALADVGGAVIGVGAVVALGSAFSTVVAVRQRFRSAQGEQRQRMRWIRFVASAAAASFGAMWILGFGAFAILGEDEELPIFDVLFVVTAMILVVGIPAAYIIAIFRHGLWELDLVMRKTIQYAILVAVFVAVGAALVVAVPTLLFGVEAEAFVPTLVVGSVLAAAVVWLRPRAARLADRLVYGRRATPYEVLSAFSERVGETFSIDDVLPRMAQLVADATGASRVDVWLRVGSALRPEVSHPSEATPASPRTLVGDVVPTAEHEHAAEVRHRGELLGAITLEPSADDPIDPAKESLVRDLAAQAGLVLRNARLIEELRASRQRLVAAQDDERRRLERNIHDGVQQQLVALTVQLRLAEQLTGRDPEGAAAMLAELQTRTTETLDDLRDLARGIYPPLLADQGLGAALTAQARKASVATTVDADGVGRFPQAVEAAVYFSCLEALNNVAKYAAASTVSISLRRSDGELRFEIVDDGVGFEPSASTYGTGLQGIADRLDAIGGDLRVDSARGRGTTVSGSVPIDAGG
ncbi:MAG TPA: sensor histidine kinase [Actinomycetota bacterium]|nr:sensor histidine kinase [Actinomycetota bacterium]